MTDPSWSEPPHVCDKVASKLPGTRVVLGTGELFPDSRPYPIVFGNGTTILPYEEGGFVPWARSEIVTREEWLARCDERTK